MLRSFPRTSYGAWKARTARPTNHSAIAPAATATIQCAAPELDAAPAVNAPPANTAASRTNNAPSDFRCCRLATRLTLARAGSTLAVQPRGVAQW